WHRSSSSPWACARSRRWWWPVPAAAARAARTSRSSPTASSVSCASRCRHGDGAIPAWRRCRSPSWAAAPTGRARAGMHTSASRFPAPGRRPSPRSSSMASARCRSRASTSPRSSRPSSRITSRVATAVRRTRIREPIRAPGDCATRADQAMTKIEKIRAVRGMNDVLPAEAHWWRRLEEAVAGAMAAYGYQQIRTPIVEPTGLFVRGIGEVTDIVEKEMYSFIDSLNGEALTLRPECTASVVRATIEHNLLYDGPKRLWYMGPMFRHERPQKGRYRQFHQVGAEALGFSGPDADCEIILLCQRLWNDLGLTGISLELNSLGQLPERIAHREALVAYFEKHVDELDADARRRMHSNPLRILDTKNPAMQALVEAAPKLADFLGEESRAHFESLQAMLRAQNVPFRINPRLVRGLDYYNL